MKIIFVGGGTGGHVSPNIAIMNEVKKIADQKKIDLDFLYVGRIKGIEREIVKKNGTRYKGIFTGKLRRYFSFKNFSDFFLILLGFIQSLFILISDRPNLVFAKGGFVTVPFCLACFVLRIPFVIHESDSVIGLSNKILFPFARKVFLGFPVDAYDKMPIKKTFFSGNPVRPEFLTTKSSKKDFFKKYNLDNSKKTVFIFGGSQGAGKINELVDLSLEQMIEHFNIIHQTGKANEQYFSERRSLLDDKYKKRYIPMGYIGDELKDFFGNTNLIVSRAGASSIAEIIVSKKPAILIPLSSSAGGHQMKNAKYLQRKGVFAVLDEEILDPKEFFEEIALLIDDEEKCKTMVNNMENIFPTNSGALIAENLIAMMQKY